MTGNPIGWPVLPRHGRVDLAVPTGKARPLLPASCCAELDDESLRTSAACPIGFAAPLSDVRVGSEAVRDLWWRPQRSQECLDGLPWKGTMRRNLRGGVTRL